MGRIHPRQHWDGLYSPPPGNSCALPRLKSQIRPRIGPGCGCRGLGSGWVERWGARRDVDRWLPRGAGARAALGRLVLTSSRKLLHRSPVKVAVPATNRVGLRLPGGGWAVGGALERWWTSSSGQHDETCTGGRRGCVRARVAPSAGRPCRRKVASATSPPFKSWPARRAGRTASPPHPPGTGLAAPVGLRRLAHRALVAQP